MIILRKPSGNAQVVILAETPTGVKNGVNQTYTTEYTIVNSNIIVFYNGQALHSPDDFTISGTKSVVLDNVYPDISDELRVTYEASGCEAAQPGCDDLDFTDLDDTPTNYAGHGGYFVKVKDTEDGLEFVAFEEFAQEGQETISNGVDSKSVTFGTSFPNTDYSLVFSLENTVDAAPSVYAMIITQKTTAGFTVLFSGKMDSTDYKLNWIAKLE